jgi:Zn-finger nucleic acid-binding protein
MVKLKDTIRGGKLMNCPNCHSDTFEVREIGSAKTLTCSNCQGVWFDPDELKQAETYVDRDLGWLEFDLWKDVERIQVTQYADRRCPVDDQRMAAVRYGPTQVTVDTCPQCRGIWLDAGEFERIIDALKDYLAQLSADDYERAALEQAEQLVTGHKGLGAEIKDLGTVLRYLQYRVLVEHPRVRDALEALQTGLPTQYW